VAATSEETLLDSKGSSEPVTPEQRPTSPIDGILTSESEAQSIFESVSAQAALVGTVLDAKYKIQALIGVGGMSAVYKAHHLALDRLVAIKLLHPHLCTERHSLERFLREGKTEAAVSHPNIVSVQAVGVTDEGRLYLVMDYLDGKSLDDLLSLGGPLPQTAATNIFIQLCDALEYAHAMGIVHRDLKPSNIMLVGPNLSIVKVVDFGVAKLLDPRGSEGQAQTNGAIVGSPPYMSPEQCLGNSTDHRSDLYSVGCLMYETITGRIPFEADSPYGMVCRHLNDTQASFAEVVPGAHIAPELEAIVHRALQKLPEKRFQSARDMCAELKRVKKIMTDGGIKAALVERSSDAGTGKTVPQSEATRRFPGKTAMRLAIAFGLLIATATVYLNFQTIKLTFMRPGLEQNIAAASQTFGPDSPQAASAYLSLADAYWNAADEESAKPLYRRAFNAVLKWPYHFRFDLPREVFLARRASNNSTEEQQSLMALGEFYKRGNETDHAIGLLEASVETKNGSPYLQEQTLIELAEMASTRRDFAAEQRYAERGISIVQADRQSPANSILLVAFLLKRAECDEFLWRPEAALSSYRKALKLLPAKERLDIVRRANIFQSIGRCQLKAGRGDEALLSLQSSLE
jgi:eukaryotic-like serine/threonine-protein kinase